MTYEAKRSKVRRALKKIIDLSPSSSEFVRTGSKSLIFLSHGWEFVIEPHCTLEGVITFSVRIVRSEDGVEILSVSYDSVNLVLAHLSTWLQEGVNNGSTI